MVLMSWCWCLGDWFWYCLDGTDVFILICCRLLSPDRQDRGVLTFQKRAGQPPALVDTKTRWESEKGISLARMN